MTLIRSVHYRLISSGPFLFLFYCSFFTLLLTFLLPSLSGKPYSGLQIRLVSSPARRFLTGILTTNWLPLPWTRLAEELLVSLLVWPGMFNANNVWSICARTLLNQSKRR
ncbi:hypothetical protein BJ166DRAFT_44562 [Pestalotiopsis sp. NC0098]|nr:hypothetical protein BJ166DRAFT_44562 [Pestalotiopsis sp. NC0098]